MDAIGNDFGYAARTLRRSPTFTLITVGILALGIGANTAIFSVTNAVMLRELPVRAPSELVHLFRRSSPSRIPMGCLRALP
jgi:putative ABC transport system permease protein